MLLSTKLTKKVLIRDVYAQYRRFPNFLNILDLQYQTYNVIRAETHLHYCLHCLSLLQHLRIRYFIEETHINGWMSELINNIMQL